jgi:hypothetical protein
VAKHKKTHNTTEELIIPCAVEIASIMFDEKTASLIKAIPSPDNTIQRRIQDMASDIVDQVVEKRSKSKQFSIQLDERTDIAGEAQPLAFVRVPDSDNIMEHIFSTFCTLTHFMEQSTLKRGTQQHIIAHLERLKCGIQILFSFLDCTF